jgi:hypothetical protein
MSARLAPGPMLRRSPFQCALASGVRMDQRMVAKRRAKNGAFASST